MSDKYRGGANSQATIKTESDIAAYAVARMPATYAAIAAAMDATAQRAPDFVPRTLLDAGAGLGSASWAALEFWPEIEQLTLLDNHPGFRAAAAQLARSTPTFSAANFLAGDMAGFTSPAPFDLVVAGYALAEISANFLPRVLDALWAACGGVLLIVEPGTPAGFERIVKARTHLLRSGAKLIAPCPHENACPVLAPDWCHFTQRLPRLRAHMQAKDATVPFEDEKFAYLAAAHESVMLASASPRILTAPDVAKGEVRLKLCTGAGLETRVVPRRDAGAYRAASRAKWGETL